MRGARFGDLTRDFWRVGYWKRDILRTARATCSFGLRCQNWQLSSANMVREVASAFPTRLGHKSVPQECPTRVCRKTAPQECPTRMSRKSVPPQECAAKLRRKSVSQECATGVPHESALQCYMSVAPECATRVSHKNVPQECPTNNVGPFVFKHNVRALGFMGSILLISQSSLLLGFSMLCVRLGWTAVSPSRLRPLACNPLHSFHLSPSSGFTNRRASVVNSGCRVL